MKKIFILFSILLILFGLIPDNTFAEEENYFIVTAYYSPLPNQEYYLKGNYEDELILNGMGIAGASGKKVFSGMLAAPKNYQFGTKIYLEGLGIGSVEDRGGAIVNAGKRGYKNDRIDVWMGYGDEGLKRALYWGKRKVKGTFLNSDTEVSININNILAPSWATKNLIQNTQVSNEYNQVTIVYNDDLELFDKYLHLNSSEVDIKLLQKIMKNLSLYSGNLTGIYDDIKDELLDYQISNKIIESIDSYGAGYFGPKTRKIMKEDYVLYLDEEKLKEKRQEYIDLKQTELEKLSEENVSIIMNKIGTPIFGEVGIEVRELQLVLKELGYFDYDDTAIFGEITKNSIIDFQIENEIITDNNDIGAGIFGPKTRETITNVLQEKYYIQLISKEDFTEEELISIIGEKI